MSKRNTVETFTLMLIGKDGSHTPIGVDGAPTFHAFHSWVVACAAIVEAVSRVARATPKPGDKHLPVLARRTGGDISDLELIEAVTVTTTQVSAAGKMLLLTLHKFSGDELRQIYDGATQHLRNQITDRRVTA